MRTCPHFNVSPGIHRLAGEVPGSMGRVYPARPQLPGTLVDLLLLRAVCTPEPELAEGLGRPSAAHASCQMNAAQLARERAKCFLSQCPSGVEGTCCALTFYLSHRSLEELGVEFLSAA